MVRIEILDSATGAALVPERVVVTSQSAETSEQELSPELFAAGAKAELSLGSSPAKLKAFAPSYHPMSADYEIGSNAPPVIRLLLDPINPPEQIAPENVERLKREGFMLIQGFIVDGARGSLLEGVLVTDLHSGQMAVSDSQGFFRMHVPAPEEMKPVGSLVLSKAGYKGLSIHNIEIWSRGDCTYRLRMNSGDASESDVMDESSSRRRAPEVTIGPVQAAETSVGVPEAELSGASVEPPQPATSPANATVRVPRNIRVSVAGGVEYVSFSYYCRAVLGSEWIASWGDIPGGTNSLNAGAVAVRCYAIARINSASATSTNDICSTTSCQVYNPAKIHARTDTAVAYTMDWVLLNGTNIASTEYSAENNSLVETTFGCPDGFSEPDSSCLYDPVCAGQARYGHGRGMCQWGSARWATGRRMNGRSSGDATPNGFSLRDWKWIVQHYYPNLVFVKGAPLVVGDDIKAMRNLDVRACPGVEITNGVNCAIVAAKTAGSMGVILSGPVVVTNDTKGFSWYKVDWGDAVGWAVENYLERVFPVPAAPTSLTANAASTNSIQLDWTDISNVEAGFDIDRAPAASGPWVRLASTPANATAYLDTGLFPGNTWYYRVRASNAGGASAFSTTADATTPLPGPTITPPSPANIAEEQLFTRTISGNVTDILKGLGDNDSFPSETANGTVLFRTPRFSGSTSGYLEPLPNLLAVTDAFPATGYGTGKVYRARFAFTNVANPWLRLTTSSATYHPNPVIDLTKTLKFRIYADKSVGVALGCRESTVAAGTPVGANGGTTGAIEWAGVTNIAGTAPMCTRVVPAGVWTTLSFNLPVEPVRNFTSGNGVLSTTSGLGVLEHIAIVPQAGTGEYNVYLDDFQVAEPRTITWSLGSGVPSGASVHPATGVVSWTPSEAQGPGAYTMQVIATASGSPVTSATNTLSVTVSESNRPPVLDPIADRAVHAGALVTFTNSAIDPDLPANALSFGLANQPQGAQVGAIDGVFSWQTTPSHAGQSYQMNLLVEDNGSPPMSDTMPFSIDVVAPPSLSAAIADQGSLALTWQSIPGATYSIHYKNALNDPAWLQLTNILATSQLTTWTNVPSGDMRFFRLMAP